MLTSKKYFSYLVQYIVYNILGKKASNFYKKVFLFLYHIDFVDFFKYNIYGLNNERLDSTYEKSL